MGLLGDERDPVYDIFDHPLLTERPIHNIKPFLGSMSAPLIQQLVTDQMTQAISKRLKLWCEARDNQIFYGTHTLQVYVGAGTGFSLPHIVTSLLVPKDEVWMWNPQAQDFIRIKFEEEFDVNDYNEAILDDPGVWE